MPDDLGSASVTITPDMAKFAADLQAGLAGADAGKVNVPIDLDKEDVAKVDAELAEIGSKSETVDIKTDTHGAAQDIKDIGTAAGDAGKKLDGLKKSASDASGPGGMGALLTAALTIGPALVPIAGAVVGIGAAAGVAATGLGAFALAAVGDLAVVKEQAQQALTQFQNLAAPSVIPVLTGAVNLLTPALSALQPIVTAVSRALLELEGNASKALSGDSFKGFIDFITIQAGPAITAFGHLFGGLGAAVAGALEAMGPLISTIDTDLTNFGTHMAAWGAGAGAPGSGFSTFLSQTQQALPLVGTLLRDLTSILGQLTVGANELGIGLLTVIDPMLTFVKVLLDIAGPNGAAVVVTIVGLVTAFNKFGPAVRDAVGSIKEFTAALAVMKGAEEATAAATTAAAVTTEVGAAAETAAPKIAGLTGLLASGVEALGGLGTAALVVGAPLAILGGILLGVHLTSGETTADIESFTKGLEKASSDTLPKANANLKGINEQLTALKPAYEQAQKAAKAQEDQLALDNAQGTTNVETYTKMTQKQRDLIDAYGLLLKARGDNTAAQKKEEDQLKAASAALGTNSADVVAAADATHQSIATQLGDLDKYSKSLGISSDELARMEAQTKETGKATLNDFNAAVKVATGSVNTYSDAIAHFSGQTSVSSGDITTFFTQTTLSTSAFLSSIQQLEARGLDPTSALALIKAGPGQAGPLVQTMVQDTSNGLIEQYNHAQAVLKQQDADVKLLTSLTFQAVKDKSGQLASSLPEEFALKTALASKNAGAMLQGVIDQYGGGSFAQVLELAHRWGTAIPQGIQDQINAAAAAANAQAFAAEHPLEAAKDFAFNAGLTVGANFPSGIGEPANVAAAATQAAVLDGAALTPMNQAKDKAFTAGATAGANFPSGLGESANTASAALNAGNVVNAALTPMQQAHVAAQLAGANTGAGFGLGVPSGGNVGTSASGANQVVSAALTPMQQSQAAAIIAGANTGAGMGLGVGSPANINAAAGAASRVSGAGVPPDQYGSAFTNGLSTGSGFAAGITAAVTTAANAAAGLAQRAINSLSGIVKPGSPSKVTRILGQQFGEGFIVGISGSIPAAVNSSTMLASQSLVALENQLKAIHVVQQQAEKAFTGDVLTARLANLSEIAFQVQSQITRSATYAVPTPIPQPIRPTGGAAITDIPQTEAAAGVSYAPTYHITLSGSTHDEQLAQFQYLLAQHDQQLLNELTAVGAR